jgi:GTP-binding protein HflX
MSDRTAPRRDDLIVESPIAATWRSVQHEQAILVGIGPGIREEDLDELAALAGSAGAEPVGRIVQSRSEPDHRTWIGKGKLDELHDQVHATGAQLVILDQELSPGQLRALEARLKVKVLDRTALILDIFALHAHTKEGKAQVELAQLNYLLPRLRGWGEAMSRLGSTSGTGGPIGTRGPGETKLEMDRRHIGRRIAKLRRDVKALRGTRDTKRARRQASHIPQVAIAGYTNAGKSTLMRRITGADVIVADQLFATLDPTTRRVVLPGGRRATISDTVGFVSKLPHDLVEAFRSTLEEVTLADLVVHIADASSGALAEQVDAVRRVLEEIGAADLPEVLVLNKIDQVGGPDRVRLARRFPGSVAVSALTGEGLDGLLRAVAEAMPNPPVTIEALIPWARGDVVAMLYDETEVLEAVAEPEGTRIRARVGLRALAGARPFLTTPPIGAPASEDAATAARSTTAPDLPTDR